MFGVGVRGHPNLFKCVWKVFALRTEFTCKHRSSIIRQRRRAVSQEVDNYTSVSTSGRYVVCGCVTRGNKSACSVTCQPMWSHLAPKKRGFVNQSASWYELGKIKLGTNLGHIKLGKLYFISSINLVFLKCNHIPHSAWFKTRKAYLGTCKELNLHDYSMQDLMLHSTPLKFVHR